MASNCKNQKWQGKEFEDVDIDSSTCRSHDIKHEICSLITSQLNKVFENEQQTTSRNDQEFMSVNVLSLTFGIQSTTGISSK